MFLVTDRDTFVRVIFTVVVLQRDGAGGDNLRESFIHIALFETVSVDISERTAVVGFFESNDVDPVPELCDAGIVLAVEDCIDYAGISRGSETVFDELVFRDVPRIGGAGGHAC